MAVARPLLRTVGHGHMAPGSPRGRYIAAAAFGAPYLGNDRSDSGGVFVSGMAAARSIRPANKEKIDLGCFQGHFSSPVIHFSTRKGWLSDDGGERRRGAVARMDFNRINHSGATLLVDIFYGFVNALVYDGTHANNYAYSFLV